MSGISSPLLRTSCMLLLSCAVVVPVGCDRSPATTKSQKTNGSKTSSGSPRTPVQAAPGTTNKSSASIGNAGNRTLPSPVPLFADVAAEAGIEFAFYSDTVDDRYFLPEVMGGGAAWLDVDRDDILDLYLMNGSHLDPADADKARHVNRLYRGRSTGGFRNVGNDCGAENDKYGQGCAVGDYNADGFPDLYLGNFGPNVLLVNNGDGTFSDVSQPAGVDDALWTSSVIWLDIDGDEDLDLYVANYLNVTRENIKFCEYDGQRGYCGPGQYESVPDHVFLNDSTGAFVEASQTLGLTGENGKGLALVAADFDQDLQTEIYVANDMAPNFLFTRQDTAAGKVRFHDVAVTAGCAQSGEGMNEASMGIACADFDGDARYDLYLTHYYQMKNTLYRNLGGLVFDDTSLRLGTAGTSYKYLGFGTAPLDYNRDGWRDLFITNGHVLGAKNPPHRMTGQLLHNSGGRRFDDISSHAGPYFHQKWLGRGVAAADYDDDGDTDILVTHIDDPVALLRNDTKAGGCFLGLDLRTESRMVPVGARVRVTADGLSQQQAIVVGGSYLCSQDQRLLFGWIGTHKVVDVEIDWPSGTTDRFTDLNVNRYWVVKQGDIPR